MKTSLVTGAGGWIGLELVKKLLEDGHTVKALNRSVNKNLIELKKIHNDRLLLIPGDMTQISEWESELRGIDYLFHLAAKVHSKPTNKDEENEFYLINRDCTKELFDKALENKVGKVVFVSTVAVYGKHGNKVIDINTERKPETPYAISKNEAEMYGLELYEKYGFPISIVQPVTVYGGNDRGNFRKLYNLSQKGLSVRFGDGKNNKSVIYYKDLAFMIKNISQSNNTNGKRIICGSESILYNNIINKIKSDSKLKIVIYVPTMISKLVINLLTISNINKLCNIASTIETLMNDNIYDFSNSIKYLDNECNTLFKNWDCKKEYSK